MNNAKSKLEKLAAKLEELESVVIAFSGGVDSSFLLKVAADTLNGGVGRVLAVTAKSSTYPQRELAEACDIAKSIGAEHRLIDSEELDIEGYAQNPTNRCYYCKGELFSKLNEIARAEGYRAVLDGANSDDLGDFRPGSDAAREKSVRSLLQEVGLNKQEIRDLSKELGLPTWNKPAFACLASRFPYGETITRQKLGRVEKAEQFLRDLGFGQIRVRNHAPSDSGGKGGIARIELDRADILKAAEPEMAEKIDTRLKEFGFEYVTLDIIGYRTGSMNENLDITAEKAKN